MPQNIDNCPKSAKIHIKTISFNHKSHPLSSKKKGQKRFSANSTKRQTKICQSCAKCILCLSKKGVAKAYEMFTKSLQETTFFHPLLSILSNRSVTCCKVQSLYDTTKCVHTNDFPKRTTISTIFFLYSFL